jgi:NTP pyrophosphatase (non-canonical NTP hydrolase)
MDYPVNLTAIGHRLDVDLKTQWLTEVPGDVLDIQALCVAEEAGELVGAYRRWAGKARRKGSFRDVEDEVADVLLTTAVFAVRAGVDLDAVVERKLTEIYSRGWSEEN